MSIIVILIPMGLILLAIAVWAFFWAVRSGQFDDLDTPAWRILTDEDETARSDRRHDVTDPRDAPGERDE